MIVKLEFELDEQAPLDNFSIAKGASNSLHEALCSAIHEQDDGARDWLTKHVINIEAKE